MSQVTWRVQGYGWEIREDLLDPEKMKADGLDPEDIIYDGLKKKRYGEI